MAKARFIIASNKNRENRAVQEPSGQEEKMSGMVNEVIFSNEENGYAVLSFEPEEGGEVILVGTLPYVGEGETLNVYGKWIHNPKYGAQFKVEHYEKVMPADAASILKYLSSGAIKGIRIKTAARIVEEFGTETFDVMENHPDWLAQIPGISRKKAQEISEDFREKAGMRCAMQFFGDSFSPTLIMRIYQKWGGGAVDVAKRNPYVLCEHIDGIGFEKADEFARSLGLGTEAPERLREGVLFLLRHNATQNGHTCLPFDKLTEASAQLLGVGTDAVEDTIVSLVRDKKLIPLKADGMTYLSDAYTYDCEKYIASRLQFIDENCIHADIREIHRFIEREEKESGLSYAELQRKAIVEAMTSGVMILTGGPGTGKTTVVRALLHIFGSMGLSVALAAPTGRAAKRLSESTRAEARTVHRMLEYSYEEGDHPRFLRDEHNYLDENVIIVDEVSMCDTYLMNALLRAVKPGSRLVLIGDADQLPSVGAGNVLHDLLESGRFSTVALSEVFRQASQSLIITNAHRINAGQMPLLDVNDNDFFFLPRSTDSAVAATVADLIRNRLPKAYGEEIRGEIQVITPSRKGEGGTEHLNLLLQSVLNPADGKKGELAHRDRVFRSGDKVMQIKNNYDIEWDKDGKKGTGVFNGDVGTVLYVDEGQKQLEVLFDDRQAVYDYSMLEELEHAYAITVHKSQGSEYPVVIIPMYSATPVLLSRNLLYTAVTRAQRMVILVGKKEIVSTMVSNERHALRYTGLSFHLTGKMGI